ncbi:PREDICTED: uncharacterized protein LOC106146767 [Chinchilla lanigera]|uniref:uncharacterized protein LOC106146767 n=1 Tax=Chinchilla lanigera TaxID=34839 RepID=UPI000696DA74|nr:PREDICTED: uncharacterized protein LOC106146767 [Chinchilla lanigera]
MGAREPEAGGSPRARPPPARPPAPAHSRARAPGTRAPHPLGALSVSLGSLHGETEAGVQSQCTHPHPHRQQEKRKSVSERSVPPGGQREDSLGSEVAFRARDIALRWKDQEEAAFLSAARDTCQRRDRARLQPGATSWPSLGLGSRLCKCVRVRWSGVASYVPNLAGHRQGPEVGAGLPPPAGWAEQACPTQHIAGRHSSAVRLKASGRVEIAAPTLTVERSSWLGIQLNGTSACLIQRPRSPLTTGLCPSSAQSPEGHLFSGTLQAPEALAATCTRMPSPVLANMERALNDANSHRGLRA